jgi:hypothetical protein
MAKVLAQLAPPGPYPDTGPGAAAFEAQQAGAVVALVQAYLARHVPGTAAAGRGGGGGGRCCQPEQQATRDE